MSKLKYLILFLVLLLSNFSFAQGKIDYADDDYNHLPVELVYFTADLENDSVVLRWGTATELNNYGFEIQRSTDEFATNWDVLGFEFGHGTSFNTWHYFFYDTTITESGTYYYRLNQLDLDGGSKFSQTISIAVTSVEANITGITTDFELHQNYPNPFNGETLISFTLNKNEKVVLGIYNLLGEKVAELVNNELNIGLHSIRFDSKSLSSGIYYYVLSSQTNSFSKKMILIK